MNDLEVLKNLVLAPYILHATTMITLRRKIGGNQFRHVFATLGILLDYKYYYDPILLKASLMHDFLEDVKGAKPEEIWQLDDDGRKVADLVIEVTRIPGEPKPVYLNRILTTGSREAKILKCADRISNLTDIHLGVQSKEKISEMLDQTEQYIIPMAREVNKDMVKEITHLVAARRVLIKLDLLERVAKILRKILGSRRKGENE